MDLIFYKRTKKHFINKWGIFRSNSGKSRFITGGIFNTRFIILWKTNGGVL